MTEKELRELDAWIAKTLFDHGKYVDPTAAMEVLKKCCELLPGGVHIKKGRRATGLCPNAKTLTQCGRSPETLELAICLFAKALFTP